MYLENYTRLWSHQRSLRAMNAFWNGSFFNKDLAPVSKDGNSFFHPLHNVREATQKMHTSWRWIGSWTVSWTADDRRNAARSDNTVAYNHEEADSFMKEGKQTVVCKVIRSRSDRLRDSSSSGVYRVTKISHVVTSRNDLSVRTLTREKERESFRNFCLLLHRMQSPRLWGYAIISLPSKSVCFETKSVCHRFYPLS